MSYLLPNFNPINSDYFQEGDTHYFAQRYLSWLPEVYESAKDADVSTTQLDGRLEVDFAAFILGYLGF